jgi:acyl-CoA oxidase
MNPDLQRERSRASFSVESMTHMLDGGPRNTERRRQLQAIIERDPSGVFDNDMNNYLHRTDRHVRALAKFVRLIELCRKIGIGDKYGGDILQDPDFGILLASVADDFPVSLHWVMFVPNIRSLCDEEQKRYWLKLCRDWQVIGCYAQTELGHGSNVRALETTATFDNDSFIINSPTLTSAKFWPGTLGKTANHAMVIARLIDGDGIDRGIHNFLVPLRCTQTHRLLPGVETGDIGPKIGYNVMDNGYARFNHVRIPRRNMAMRFAHVDERGKYFTKADGAASKIAYITMMQVRAHICNEAGKNLAMACTIAIRYSAVRRQGYGNKNDDTKSTTELQVLDYKQQQHRLFPLLAASYCFHFTGKKILQRLVDLENTITKRSKVLTKAEIKDVHASSSALKSFTTTVAADGIEECRKACGGHGFLQCSGLPELFTTYLQNPTVEGDNHMLPQQVIRVLLKLVEAVQKGDDLKDYEPCDSYYLVPSLQAILRGQNTACHARTVTDLLEIPTLLDIFRHRSSRVLLGVARQLQTSVKKGSSFSEAWNQALVEMARASRAYSQFLLLQNFVDGIIEDRGNGVIGDREVSVLQDLARLFALYWMEREMGDFLEDGYLSAQQSQWVRTNVLDLLATIRPNAVALVDARDFSDFRLKSALGRYDGDVYPAIMAAAKKDPLNNQGDPGPGYEAHLKRLIEDGVGRYSGTASRL